MVPRGVRIVALFAIGILIAGCGSRSGTAVGHAELEAIGEWTGRVDQDGNGIVRMSIDEQSADGAEFAGELEISTHSATTSWAARAELTPHGHLVISAGDAAAVEAHITDPDTLDYCLTTYGTDPVYFCGRLVRAPRS